MDLMRLDIETYQPTDLIEGYSSLIWTERFREAGEVQLKSPLIEDTMNAIPEGSLVCIRESKEVMMIETHSVAVNADGVRELTTKGRTFETFLEKRILTGEYNTPWEMQLEYKVQDALMVTLWNAIVNPTEVDVTRTETWPHALRENLPNVAVSDSIILTKEELSQTNDLTTIQQWFLDMGPLYPKILDFLNLGDIGIRIIRPWTTTINTIDVASDGVIDRDIKPADSPKLLFDIYNGRNRTITPSVEDPLPPVIFRHDVGDIEGASYLFSKKDFRNYARIVSQDNVVEIWSGDGTVFGTPTAERIVAEGLDLSMMYLDIGQISDDVTDEIVYMTQKGHAALAKARRVALIDGSVSPHSTYRYKVDYDLGDQITLQGEFDVNTTMVVNEFVRTEDSSGENGYPTLVEPAVDE